MIDANIPALFVLVSEIPVPVRMGARVHCRNAVRVTKSNSAPDAKEGILAVYFRKTVIALPHVYAIPLL